MYLTKYTPYFTDSMSTGNSNDTSPVKPEVGTLYRVCIFEIELYVEISTRLDS